MQAYKSSNNSNENIVCLNTSQYLKRFNLPLLRYLSQQESIAKVSQWEYEQEFDEPNSMDNAVELLAGYLRAIAEPVHLIGHGTAGLLGLLFSQRYPELMKSLTLLSVGIYPTVCWQSQYYAHRQFFHCDRQTVLIQIAYHLFGYRDSDILERLAVLLKHDLDYSLCPHSLFRQEISYPISCSKPLLICGSEDDLILGKSVIEDWKVVLKDSDRYNLFPKGRHFFHYFYAREVGRVISKFLYSLPNSSQSTSSIAIVSSTRTDWV